MTLRSWKIIKDNFNLKILLDQKWPPVISVLQIIWIHHSQITVIITLIWIPFRSFQDIFPSCLWEKICPLSATICVNTTNNWGPDSNQTKVSLPKSYICQTCQTDCTHIPKKYSKTKRDSTLGRENGSFCWWIGFEKIFHPIKSWSKAGSEL